MTRFPESKHGKRNNLIFYLSLGIVILFLALATLIIFICVFSVDTKTDLSVSEIESSHSEISSDDVGSSNGNSTVSASSDNQSNLISEPETDSSTEAPVSSKEITSQQNEPVSETVYLDPEFSNILLVNSKNPLPEDYDYESHLGKVDTKYIKGSFRQLDAQVIPYITAMIDAAWKDGVQLYIASPYRSYERQTMLFKNKIDRVMKSDGLDYEAAKIKAATVVAPPGTSEHHTGLAVDFNSVDDSFESTPMFKWLKENAENYGFIMRYSDEKYAVTGIIHESWHWRFVGINTAKEINGLGMCLEEYLMYKGIQINPISE